jgi:hypothetical protein
VKATSAAAAAPKREEGEVDPAGRKLEARRMLLAHQIRCSTLNKEALDITLNLLHCIHEVIT